MDNNQNPQEGQDQPLPPSEGGAPDGQPKGRTAEDRINELLSKVKETTDELATTREELAGVKARLEQPVPAAPPMAGEPESPDVAKAIDFLKSKGKFVDEAALRREVQSLQDRMYLDNNHQRLESSYDGSDGKPKYDRSKIEQYMRSHPVYDPEIAYEQIYKDELFDWRIKQLEADRKTKPYVARPSPTGGVQLENDAITKEKLAEVYKNPTHANRMWYEQNREKIHQLMAQQKL